jgi:drug/metabolite transporter (DMT)-like permease
MAYHDGEDRISDMTRTARTWRPSPPWRWVIIGGVFFLAVAPTLLGLSMIEDWREAPVFPLALIVFGPLTVVSVFVALTPFLEGWWLKRWRPGRSGQGRDGGAEGESERTG